MSGTEGLGSNESARESRGIMNLDDLELELRKLPGVRSAGFSDREDVLLIQLQVSGAPSAANLPLQATRIAYRHSDKPVALEVVRWRVMPATHDHDALDGDGDGHGAFEPVLPGAVGVAGAEPAAPDEAREAESADEPAPTAATEPAPDATGAPDRLNDRGMRVRLLAVLTFPDTDELEVHLTHDGRRIIGRSVASNGIIAVVDAMVDGLKVFVPRLEFTSSWARVLEDDRGNDHHLVACELVAPDQSRRLGIAAGASAIEAAARATLHALNRSIAQHLVDDGEGDAVSGAGAP